MNYYNFINTFIHKLSDFQRESYNLGYKIGIHDYSANDKKMTEMFRDIIDFVKENTSNNTNKEN